MNQKLDDQEENEMQVNDIFTNLSQQKARCYDKLNPYLNRFIQLIEQRQIVVEEAIKLFPISYVACIGMGLSYTFIEEVNWFVLALVIIALLGIFTHYLQKKLAIKLILRLVFTSLLLFTLAIKLKIDYFSSDESAKHSSKKERLMNLFLFGHIYISLNDSFGMWEIDFIIALIQTSGVIYFCGGFCKIFSFWFLFLFPFFVFLKKSQSGIWVQKYLSLYHESGHLQQIFHDVWPHNLFVTTLDCNKQVNVQYFNRKAKDLLSDEKTFASLFKKITFSSEQKNASNMSLGTYSKKDNLWQLLETKHRKFEEQCSVSSQYVIATPKQAQTSNQIVSAEGVGDVPTQPKQINERNRSIKQFPHSSISQSKRHHSSLSNKQIYAGSDKDNGMNQKEEDVTTKRKSTNIWSDAGNNQMKNTQTDCEGGQQQKMDKYKGMYYYSLDSPDKFKPIIVKIYYYSKGEDASKTIYQNRIINSTTTASLIPEQKQKRFLFVQLKTTSIHDLDYPSTQINTKYTNATKPNEKFGLLKIAKKFAKDINGHFSQIIAPYKQLVDQLLNQQIISSQYQQQLQTSSLDQQKLQTNNILENNTFKFHLEYIQAQINTLIDYLRIQLNKPTKLIVQDLNMQQLFSDFFTIIRDSTEKQMDFLLDMDPLNFPEKYRQDSRRVYQILHFLFQRLITMHDCINPKFILKVSFTSKRTDSLFNPHSLSFQESKLANLNSNQQNTLHRESCPSQNHRKSTLKHVANLYSSSNCFTIELILKGHCHFESVINKQQLKDKDKLFRTIEKLSQYLGSSQIEFITEKDSLLRKYIFSLREVTPRQTNNKQEFPATKDIPDQQQVHSVLDQADSIQVQKLQQDNAEQQKNAKNAENKITLQTDLNTQNLEKILYFNPFQNNTSNNADTLNHPLNTPKNMFQFQNTNVFQLNQNELYDSSQQSINAIMHESDSQVIINSPLQFQSRFIK